MRVAFLADIHANLGALETALAEIGKQAVDGIFHLGNVVGFGGEPFQVVARLMAAGIEGVRGNHEDRVLGCDEVRVGATRNGSQQVAERVCEWTRGQLTPKQMSWLEHLPFTRQIKTGRLTIALFNATPISMNLPPHEGQSDDFFREMADYTGADVHVFAHTHHPFWRVVDGRWFVNAGSVGLSEDTGREVSYALVDLNGGAAVRIVRLPYDHEKAAGVLRQAGLPSLPGILEPVS
ncbi:MAG: metallophosphoesterase family protein [Acidobacteriota bacterium]